MTSLPAPPSDVAVPLLVGRTTRLDPTSATALLDLLPDVTDPALLTSWVRGGNGLVGWGRIAEHRSRGVDRFAQAQDWWREVASSAVVRDEVQVPGTGPVAFGSLTFSGDSAHDSVLLVPEVVVGRRGEDAWVTTLTLAPNVPGTAVLTAQEPPQAPISVAYTDGPLDAAGYAAAVAEAVARIGAGDLDKVVLARSLEVLAGAPIDVRWLLQRLAQRYDNTWAFAVDGLVGATPEMLVRLERGLVTSRVLAGTIQRSGHDEKDLALAASLARSSKDLEEHEYAVRSVADALAVHTSSMNVPESPFVLHLSNVMHLATDVTAVARPEVTSLDLAASLHPSAAVCGTPTATAGVMLAELEQMDRGRYAGPVGWMDTRGDGDWGIALRCGAYDAADPSRMTLYAGCGIVAGSDPTSEVAESVAKFLPMREALHPR